MVFDYTLPGAMPGLDTAVWSNGPIQPLAAGPLTPFSYSVLEGIAGRAWYAFYDRLGFAPPPRPRILRRYRGRAYLNLSLPAQIEAEQAGIAPLTLQINGAPFPLAAWEKPSFLKTFKTGRAQGKLDDLVADLARRMPAITQAAQTWQIKTREARWSQAEVLQVMEEIERAGQESMMAYLAARHQLTQAYARLLAARAPGQAVGAMMLLINSALCDLTGLVESEMAAALISMSEQVQDPAPAIAWLKAGDFQHWQKEIPHRSAGDALAGFLRRYGHRTMGEGELSNPRWHEEPDMVLRGLLACIEYHPRRPGKMPAGNYAQKVLDALQPEARKEGGRILQQLHDLYLLQSRALDALGYIWTGTRRWALAAAQEAMGDRRLQSPSEVFFFELEEIKQMMTGEWNVSSQNEIRERLAERMGEHAENQTIHPADLLIGDQEAVPVLPARPGVAGRATGALRRWAATRKNGCQHAIMGAEMLDSGWALGLPLADGFVAALGSPLDPFVAAARAWHHPVVVALGDRYHTLVEGAQTTVDGTHATVSQ